MPNVRRRYFVILILVLLILFLLFLFRGKDVTTPSSIREKIGAIFDVKAGPLSGCRDHTAIFTTEPYLKNIVYAKH